MRKMLPMLGCERGLWIHLVLGLHLFCEFGAADPTALGALVQVAQDNTILLDLRNYTRNSGDASLRYSIVGLAGGGQIFYGLKGATVPQGQQICCPPALLPNSYVYYVPGPNEAGVTDLRFAVTRSALTQQATFDVSDPAQQWSIASIVLNVTKNKAAPYTGSGGGMLYFDGLQGFAVAKTEAFPTQSFTISLWMKCQRTRALQTLFTLFSSAGRELELSDVMDLRVLRGTNQATDRLGIFLADGKWHFVAVTWSLGQVALVVDGYQQLSQNLSSQVNTISSSVQFVLGNRLICSALTAREQLRVERDALLKQTKTVEQPTGTATICQAEAPTAGCNFTLNAKQVSFVLDRMDADDIVGRNSVPAIKPFYWGVKAGAWVCKYSSQLCVHGSPTVMDDLACNCTVTGCLEPRFAFSGWMDEVRVYSYARTTSQLSLDAQFAIGNVVAGLSLGRTEQHYQGLVMHYHFDDRNWITSASLQFPDTSFPAQAAEDSPPLLLGGGGATQAPQKMPSSAPLFGAYQQESVIMDSVSANLIKLSLWSSDVAVGQLHVRIVNPLPLLGDLYWAEYTPRGGFSIGQRISLPNTILPIAQKVGTIPRCTPDGGCTLDGIKTCLNGTSQSNGVGGNTSCVRDGFYLFYIGRVPSSRQVADVIGVQSSTAPYLDETGAPLPVVASPGLLVLVPAQPALPVPFSEEVVQDTPAVVYLQTIMLTDQIVDMRIAQVPSNGSLRHLIEADCEAVESYTEGACRDILAVYPYCNIDTFQSLLVNESITSGSGGGGSWKLSEIEATVYYRNCTDLAVLDGLAIEPGTNDTALLCGSFINQTETCEVVSNATCRCPHPNRCLADAITGHTTPLGAYRVTKETAYIVVATLGGYDNVVRWLLSIGAPLSATAIELAAARGNYQLVRLMLTQRVLPDSLDMARAAASKRMQQNITELIESTVRSRLTEGPMHRRDGAKRCLFPGPLISQDLPNGFLTVSDPEFRVIFDPARHFYGAVPVPIDFRVGGYDVTLTASLSLQVVYRATTPEVASVEVTASSEVTYIDLPVLPFDGPARAVIVDFPKYGSLFNAPTNSGGGTNASIILGAPISRIQKPISLYPSAIYNTSAGGELYILPTGPWRGSLNYTRVADCDCTLNISGAFPGPCRPVDDWYDSCGLAGYHALMVQYSKMLHPTKVTLRSYMPVDTQVRILARRAPWAWNEWAKVSKQSGKVTGSDWGNTTGRRSKDTLLDGVVFRSQGASISTGGTAAQACGLQAPWKQLWAGTAGSAGAGGGTGIVSPAFLPPDFPTDTLLIEVCGLQYKGFAMTDGGDVLEGMRAVQLTGTVGPPQGLVTNAENRIAYVRTGDNTVTGSNIDSFTFYGYDGYHAGAVSGSARVAPVTIYLPGEVGFELNSTRSVIVESNSSVMLLPHNGTEIICGGATTSLSQSCKAFVIRSPARGVLSTAYGPLGGTVAALPCATGVQGIAVPGESNFLLMYTPEIGGGGRNYSTIRMAFCGPGGLFLTQTILLTVRCPAGFFIDQIASICRACPPGTFLGPFNDAFSCQLCPPGTSAAGAAAVCKPCPPGSVSVASGQTTCKICPPGTYAPDTGKNGSAAGCIECPPGTYGAGNVTRAGISASCRECGSITFAPVKGMSACLSCPVGTISHTRTAVSMDQCECMGGTYNLGAMRGVACHDCPTGAFCAGGNLPPVRRDHFWTAPEMWTSDTVAVALCNFRMVRGVCVGYPTIKNITLLQGCSYRRVPGLCDTWPADVQSLPGDYTGGQLAYYYGTGLVDPSVSNRSRPADGVTFLEEFNLTRLYVDAGGCKEGYQGRLCAECAGSWYRELSGHCSACPYWGNFITYLAWFSAWSAAALALWYLGTGPVHANFMILCLLQELHCIGRYGLAWPSFVMYGLNCAGLAVFDLEMLPWSCFGVPMSFMDLWYLSLFIPVIVATFTTLRHMLPWLVTTKYYFVAKGLAIRVWVWLWEEKLASWRSGRLATASTRVTQRINRAREAAESALKKSNALAAVKDSAALAKLKGALPVVDDKDSVVGEQVEDDDDELEVGSNGVSAINGEQKESLSTGRLPSDTAEPKSASPLKEGNHSDESVDNRPSVVGSSRIEDGIDRPRSVHRKTRWADEIDEVNDNQEEQVQAVERNEKQPDNTKSSHDNVPQTKHHKSDAANEAAVNDDGVKEHDSDVVDAFENDSEDGEGGVSEPAGAEGDERNDVSAVQGSNEHRRSVSAGGTSTAPAAKKKGQMWLFRRGPTTAAAAAAKHFRRECVDAAVQGVLGILAVFLLPSAMQVAKIFACQSWAGGRLSALIAQPQIECTAASFSISSLVSTAQDARAKVMSSEQKADPPTVTRPVAAVTMAVLLFPPQLLFVAVAGNLHLYLAMRLRGGWGAAHIPPALARRYGLLTRAFEGKYWWWNLVVTLRRLVIALSLTNGDQPYTQAFVPFGFCLVSFLATIIYRPYKSERLNAMEAGSLAVIMSMLLLGLMNPIDLSLAKPDLDGDWWLPHDTNVTIGTLLVVGSFGWWALGATRAEIKDAQLTVHLIPVKFVRVPILLGVRFAFFLVRLPWFFFRWALRRPRSSKVQEDIGWRNQWEKDKFSIRKRIYELERQLDEEARFDSKSCILLFLERERKRAVDLSFDLLKRLHEETFEELYDNQIRLEGLGHDVPIEMELIKDLEDKLKIAQDRNSVLRTRLEVEARKAAMFLAKTGQAGVLPGSTGADSVMPASIGVEAAAVVQDRQRLSEKVQALEDKLHELELMLLDDEDF